jgi:uncharacterized protein YndB with AHSA1/START domain
MTRVEVSRTIAAAPETVWDLVSDVTSMGRWSPETVSCRWIEGSDGPEVGARFRGVNAYRLRRWATTCSVVGAERGRRFAFDVDFRGIPVAHWAYDMSPAAGGTIVTETWVERRPLWLRLASVPALWVVDRGEHNRRGMERTLAALAEAAESAT